MKRVSGRFCRSHRYWPQTARSAPRLLRATAGMLFVIIVVAACADDDSERRVANDPIPTENIAAQPTQPPEVDLPTSTAPPASPMASDQRRYTAGASSRLYAATG